MPFCIAAQCGWHVEQVARRDILVEVIYLFKLTADVEKKA